jgi:hypothetical protein
MERATTGRITGSGTIVSGPAEVTTLGFVSSNAAGNVKFRDGGTNGQIRWELSGIDKAYSGQIFNPPLRFKTDVYCEFTNTGIAYVAIVNPQANQI